MNQQRVDAISSYSKSRLAVLSSVLAGSGPTRASTDDSDDDCYTIDFKEGTIVDAR